MGHFCLKPYVLNPKLIYARLAWPTHYTTHVTQRKYEHIKHTMAITIWFYEGPIAFFFHVVVVIWSPFVIKHVQFVSRKENQCESTCRVGWWDKCCLLRMPFSTSLTQYIACILSNFNIAWSVFV